MSDMKLGKPIDILMVEDDPEDVQLTRDALKNGKFLNALHVMSDGEEALAYLKRQGRHADAARPDLILLDLNLPKMNGRELLQEIKKDPELKIIPVVILTTSEEDKDVLESYQLYANCYIIKPVDLDQFVRVAKSIESFWLTIVKLPPK